MEALRILGLDDDNHSPMFRCEDGTMFNTYKELVEFLAKPHDCQAEVKMFAIVDEWTGRLEEFEEHEVDQMFCFLEGLGGANEKEPDFIFNLFWESANRYCW
jgi:hypothetical protein